MSLLRFVKTLTSTFQEDQRYLKKSGDKRSEYAEALFQNGYVIVPDYISPEQCSHWENLIRGYIGQPEIQAQCENPLAESFSKKYESGAELQVRQSFDGREYYDTGMIDFLDIHQEITELQQYREDSVIKGIIEEAQGAAVELGRTNLYRTLSLKNPRSFHMDVYRTTIYKSFIYLTDVPSTDYGPYSYITASHRPTMSRYMNLTYNKLHGYPSSDARIYPKNLELNFTASRGTLIITNQRGYHRGHPQKDNHERLVLVNSYQPA